ncbi:MAG: hypothetical protein KY460_17280, partial [Actinobacteria bacterium]|nr:hypothetical protein [Actinomycetota bacterium]
AAVVLDADGRPVGGVSIASATPHVPADLARHLGGVVGELATAISRKLVDSPSPLAAAQPTGA